jgi:transposase
MFARKKRNASGSVSVQIIDKVKGYKVVQTVGSATHPDEIARLWLQGQQITHAAKPGQLPLLPVKSERDLAVENIMRQLSNSSIRTVGPELIFGTLFDRIGFNAIPDELFRHIVIARLAFPTSKLKTVDYLYRFRGITMSISGVYRFLDTLKTQYIAQAKAIACAHTKRILGTIAVVFYDMTTLYFETEDEDDLRKIGFSKDGKFQHPQIMLGLLVGEGGFPIGYDIFRGNTFEGKTLLPTLQRIEKAYDLGKPIVVADAGLLSNRNVAVLAKRKYRYILGARIRNETKEMKEQILEKAQKLRNGDSCVLQKEEGMRLLVTYSDTRAKKDRYNRAKGLRKLRRNVRTGKLTKESINNRGYNKFLRLEGKIRVTIDEKIVKEDARWDGLKGYLTNTDLSPKKIVEHYGHLWRIEKAFSISKTDLRVRPIHHYRKRRIEAHICIAFVAYAIWKELERTLASRKIAMSPRRAGELTQNMYELHYTLPDSGEEERVLLEMDAEQAALYGAIRE